MHRLGAAAVGQVWSLWMLYFAAVQPEQSTSVETWNGDGLDTFLGSLAEDFRGLGRHTYPALPVL
ncbi:hypothetical protein STENM327S_08843 [Streptomyces tendae]